MSMSMGMNMSMNMNVTEEGLARVGMDSRWILPRDIDKVMETAMGKCMDLGCSTTYRRMSTLMKPLLRHTDTLELRGGW